MQPLNPQLQTRKASTEEVDALLLKMAKQKPVKPAPALPAPEIRPEIADEDAYALEFEDAVSFARYFLPELKLYKWQVEELIRLSGWNSIEDWKKDAPKQVFTDKAPALYHLVAANGSGKDAFVIAIWTLWLICCHKNANCIATSASVRQINDQTWTYIRSYAEKINRKLNSEYLDIVHHRIKTGGKSVFKCFVTDDPGKVEGYHKMPGEDAGPFVIIVNEAKSISEDIWDALFRCHGFSHWLEISSPDKDSGHFYDRVRDSVKYPAPLKPMEHWSRKVTAFDCPHLESAITRANMELPGGLTHPLARSSLLAEFISFSSLHFVDIEWTRRKVTKSAGTKRAGIDLALSEGGDERVISIWCGNYREAQYTSYESSPSRLRDWISEKLLIHNVQPGNIWADAGGSGLPIVKELNEKHDWGIHHVINNTRASDKRFFRNRGTELLWRFALNIQMGNLIPPTDDRTFMRQLLDRRYIILDGNTIIAEPKDKLKESPDRLDAAVLANCQVLPQHEREVSPLTIKDRKKFNLQQYYEEQHDRLFNIGMAAARQARARHEQKTARLSFNEQIGAGGRPDPRGRDSYQAPGY
jgi:hypothetical protein